MDSDLVAVVHYNSNLSITRIRGNRMYQFESRNGVSLAWVYPEDVDALCSLRAKLCCNKKVYKYHRASPGEIKQWQL